MNQSNSIEGRALPYVERVEDRLAELDRMKGEYMAECKAVRSEIKEIYKDAKEDELPVRALKGLVKYRALERKQAALAADMEEEAEDYETLVAALGQLGDTPLGQAVLDLAAE